MAFKKGVLTDSDIRVLDSHSKKNLTDAIKEPDPVKKTSEGSEEKN